MTDGAVTGIGVIHEERVPLFYGAVIRLFKAVDEAAKLADHHFAIKVGNHRKCITLFPYSWRHSGAKQNGVHFPTCV